MRQTARRAVSTRPRPATKRTGTEERETVAGTGHRRVRTEAHVTATAFGPRSLALLFSIFAALVAAFALSDTAFASADAGTVAPAISSDKADYAPGELVTLRGSNWRAGEIVTIDVNDDA